MWMVDSNDNHGQESKMSADDPTFGRKLRPLMPRPISSCAAPQSIPFSPMSTPSCFCTQNPNILPIWNHPIGTHSDYGVKREIHTVPLVSTRWNPTPEQLQTLEEMYRWGTRTPSAEQIQQIAARLRRFGKIEGKNVFYWFQNHKARERQKKRRQLELLSGKKIQIQNNVETSETKQTGLSCMRYFEMENHKKLPAPSNCSTPSEDSVSMHGSVIAERKKDVWIQLHHQKELQTAKNEITSWKLALPSCNNNNNNNYVHTITNSLQKVSSAGQENTKPSINDDNDNIIESVINENRTLQLFPIGSVDLSNLNHEDEIHDVSSLYLGNKSRPNQFIEFLPTKK